MTNKKRKSSGRMASKGFPNPIDVHVGNRLRMRRTLLGVSQMVLAEALGLTFQQVQKYERGANRVSSSRLFDLTRILDVPINYFFEDMAREVEAQSPGSLKGTAPRIGNVLRDPAAKRETVELVRAYYGISDPAMRRSFKDLVKTIGRG
jgi:transcriptional regulator with XRE-family HTH domain